MWPEAKLVFVVCLPRETILMLTFCAATEGYVNIHVTPGGHVDDGGLCCHLKPCWCLWSWSVLPLETMLILVIYAAAGSHVDVHVPCCHQRLCGCPRSVPPLEAIWKFHVTAGCDGQESFFCSDIKDCKLIIENERHRGLCDYTPQK